jgi:hypothetical protein
MCKRCCNMDREGFEVWYASEEYRLMKQKQKELYEEYLLNKAKQESNHGQSSDQRIGHDPKGESDKL